MSAAWKRDKERTDPFLPTVKSILGRVLIADAPIEVDQKQATDLLVLTLAPFTIGVRIRDAAKYLRRYPYEFTIRRNRPSGAKSEFAKIAEGWGDFLFYGFGDFETHKLLAYTVIDLKAFRAHLIRVSVGELPPPDMGVCANGDNSSDFHHIDWRTLEPECIRHQYPPREMWAQFGLRAVVAGDTPEWVY
jgi:hypothetical protein